MALGSVQSIVVCQPAAGATAKDQMICPPLSGQFYVPKVTVAYVIEASQGPVLDASLAPVDYGVAGAFWAFGLTTVVSCYLLSHGVGLVLGFLRRA